MSTGLRVGPNRESLAEATLRLDIIERLKAFPEMDLVECEIVNEVIWLRGWAPFELDKQFAGELALAVGGVPEVQNHISTGRPAIDLPLRWLSGDPDA
jgi:hypothetical protein